MVLGHSPLAWGAEANCGDGAYGRALVPRFSHARPASQAACNVTWCREGGNSEASTDVGSFQHVDGQVDVAHRRRFPTVRTCGHTAMGLHSHTLSLNILQAYYPVVKTLGEYLRGAIAFNKGHTGIGLTHETDSYVYRKLLESFIVGTSFKPEQSMRVAPTMSHLREVCSALVVNCTSPDTSSYRFWSEPRLKS